LTLAKRDERTAFLERIPAILPLHQHPVAEADIVLIAPG